jgi:hypothetical protein
MSERERSGERTRREGEEREWLGPDIDADGRRTEDAHANDGSGLNVSLAKRAAGTRHTAVGTTTGERTTTGARAGPA